MDPWANRESVFKYGDSAGVGSERYSCLIDGDTGLGRAQPAVAKFTCNKGRGWWCKYASLEVARTFERIRKKIREIIEYWLFTFSSK